MKSNPQSLNITAAAILVICALVVLGAVYPVGQRFAVTTDTNAVLIGYQSTNFLKTNYAKVIDALNPTLVSTLPLTNALDAINDRMLFHSVADGKLYQIAPTHFAGAGGGSGGLDLEDGSPLELE